MSVLEKYILFLFLGLIFIFEGFGIPYGRVTSIFLIVIPPIILFSLARKNKQEIKFSKKLSILFLLFLAFSFISSIFSTNIINSITYLLLYTSTFLMFIYVHSYKQTLAKPMIYFIIMASVVFCLGSIVINQFSINIVSGYQMVFASFRSHNHLGDFLILPLISCLYFLLNKRRIEFLSIKYNPITTILFIILLLPFFLFSFSRSAYLSLSLTLIIMIIYLIKKASLHIKPFPFLMVGIFITISTSILFIISISGSVNQYLSQNHNLQSKILFGARGEFAREAILSTIERPLTGVGAGNFVDVAKKFNPIEGRWTESSHNILLDMLSENGILAFIFFCAILFVIFKNSKKNVYFFMALGLFINFQTDYTFRIFSLLLLFFILVGLSYDEKHS